MTEGKELRRALQAHQTRDTGRLDRVALRGSFDESRAGLWGGREQAAGDRGPLGYLLGADLHDPRGFGQEESPAGSAEERISIIRRTEEHDAHLLALLRDLNPGRDHGKPVGP